MRKCNNRVVVTITLLRYACVKCGMIA